MRTTLQFVGLIILSVATPAYAQISNPDNLVAPTPRNPAQRAHVKPVEDLQWLWQFTRPTPNGRADDLRMDPRFLLLLQDSFKQPQAMWGSPQSPPPLASIIPLFLTKYGTVTAEKNRIITIDGCVSTFCPAHGLLWIDLGTAHPLLVFVAVNWSTEAHATEEAAADYNLWLFPNHNLSPDALPLQLTESLSHWDVRLAAAHRLVPHIGHALIVEPDGQPFALDPQLAGANTIAPQPDTTTPKDADEN